MDYATKCYNSSSFTRIFPKTLLSGLAKCIPHCDSFLSTLCIFNVFHDIFVAKNIVFIALDIIQPPHTLDYMNRYRWSFLRINVRLPCPVTSHISMNEAIYIKLKRHLKTYFPYTNITHSFTIFPLKGFLSIKVYYIPLCLKVKVYPVHNHFSWRDVLSQTFHIVITRYVHFWCVPVHLR